MSQKPSFIDEDIFTFIYDAAMNDATRRTGAASIKNEILKLDKVKTLVCDYAESIIEGLATEGSFMKCVNQIEALLRSNCKYGAFTFGNIQKLINMTMKYLYIRYRDTDKAAGFDLCHAPMDSQMIKKVRQAAKKAAIPCSIDSECAWSKICNDTDNPKYSMSNYKGYQETISSLLAHPKIKERCKNHLDFDYRYWGLEEII